jgi:uncharacterized membrane protein YfcA
VAFGGAVIVEDVAVVEGDAVSFGGSVVKADGSMVHGESVSMGGAGILSISLGIALLLTALAIVFRQKLQRYALSHAGDRTHTRFQSPTTVGVGVILGILVTVSSVGAGALGVAVLFFLYPKLPAIRVVGSDLAHAVPLTLVAGVGHWAIGGVDWSLLGSLLLGSLPGIWLGSHVSAKVPERVLRPLLASMLVLVGGRLISL